MANRRNSWNQPPSDRCGVIYLSVLRSSTRTTFAGSHRILLIFLCGRSRHSMRFHAGNSSNVASKQLGVAVSQGDLPGFGFAQD